MLTPTPVKQRITIKLTSVPSYEAVSSKKGFFYVEHENQLFRINITNNLYQKLTTHQYKNWVGVIFCNQISKADGITDLHAHQLSVFEKKPKKKKVARSQNFLVSSEHPNALVVTEKISGESVTELFKALDARKISTPEFRYIPIDGGFVCVAEVPEIATFETIAVGKKQAKNWAAKLLLQKLREKARFKRELARLGY